MPAIILLIVSFVIINTAIKISFWKLWQIAFIGVLFGVFVWVCYPFAITKSQIQIYEQLQDKTIRQNFVALLTVETFIYMAFCFTSLTHYYQPGEKISGIRFLLNDFPGLLIFPALFYLFTFVVFNFSGVDFSKLALYFSLLIAITLPLLSLGIKWMFKEDDFRIEMLFISGALVVVLGLISTFQDNMVYKTEQETNLINFVLTLGGILLIVVSGLFSNKVYWKIKNKK